MIQDEQLVTREVPTGLPVRVLAIDLERLPKEISPAHPSGGIYHGAWVLVRKGLMPQQLMRLEFAGAPITREQIETHVDRHAPAPVRSEAVLPSPPVRISVVICTVLGREQELRAALESVCALDYPDFEVLVVDNRPQSATASQPAWLAQLPGVRVLREPRPGLSAARNCALAAATGELIAFTDDDVIVDGWWLDALARRFEAHPDEACVTGLVLPNGLETPAQATFEAYYDGFGPRVFDPSSFRLEGAPRTRVLSRATIRETDDAGHVRSRTSLYGVGKFGVGANMAFRTAILRAGGGFNVALGAGTPALGGEDIGMFARLAWQGHSLGFEPAALVYHRHREDDASLRRQIEAYGIGFIATMLALAQEDHRHLGALLATTPTAIDRLSRSFWRKLRAGEDRRPKSAPQRRAKPALDTPESTVSELARIEMRGMAKGPTAYWNSRRWARTLDRAATNAATETRSSSPTERGDL